MEQISIYEGLERLKKTLVLREISKRCGKGGTREDGIWITQRLGRYSRTYGAFQFREEDVSMVNIALHELGEELANIKLPYQKDNREGFLSDFRIYVLKYVKASHFYNEEDGVVPMKQSRWALCMREEGHKLWFKPEQVDAINTEIKRLGRELQQIELTYEPLNDDMPMFRKAVDE